VERSLKVDWWGESSESGFNREERGPGSHPTIPRGVYPGKNKKLLRVFTFNGNVTINQPNY